MSELPKKLELEDLDESDLRMDIQYEIIRRYNTYADQQTVIEQLVKEIRISINDIDCPAVVATGDWELGMNCGLEDKNITDRYEACRYGHDHCLNKVQEWIIDPLIAALAVAEKLKETK